MKRAVCILSVSLVSSIAVSSSADVAPVPSASAAPPAPSASATPVQVVDPSPALPAKVPPPAQAEFVPDPNSFPTPHWYGWQPMMFDLLAGLQGGLAIAFQVDPLYVTAGLTYLFGPIGVHLYHQRPGNIALSAAFRMGMPGLGAAGGWAVEQIAAPSKSSDDAIAIGAGVGCIVAAIIDDVWVSREMLQFWEKDGALTVAPLTAKHVAGLSLVGTF